MSIHTNQLDVTDYKSVNNGVQAIVSEAGAIDVLVNNAGYGLSGAFEDLAMEEVKDQYETNIFGVIRTTQAVLPIMRQQKSGIIVNISSGAGRFGPMAYELEPFGIKVILVEPGVIKTNFPKGMVIARKSQNPNSPYFQIMQKIAASFEQMLENGSAVDLVAKVVLTAVKSENPSLRYLAGKDVEMWIEGKKTMSDDEFYKMMKQNMVTK